jgi:DNA primase
MDRNSLYSILEGLRNLGIIRSHIHESGESHFKFSCFMAAYRHDDGDDRSPSMTAYICPDGPSSVKCFACGYRKKFVTALEDLNALTQGAVLNLLDTSRTIEDETRKARPPAPKVEKKVKINNYNNELTQYFRTGIPPEGVSFIESKGVPIGVARWLKFSWIEQATRYRYDKEPYEIRNAVLIPVLSRIQGRTICVGAQYRPLQREGKRAKYGTFFKFSSGHFLYGEHLLDYARGERLFVHEGSFDAAHFLSLGERAVALIGLFLGKSKIRKIIQAAPRVVYVMLDPDQEGQNAATTVVKELVAHGVAAQNIVPPKDPKLMTKDDLRNLLGF